MAFAKLKAHLRRIGARTISALWDALGNICDLYTPDECRSHGMSTGSWDRYRGHASTYDVRSVGYNGRFDDIRAAIGLIQLGRLDQGNRRRGELVQRYRSRLARLTGVHVPFAQQNESAFHLSVVLLPSGVERGRIMRHMAEAGFQTSIHYPPAHHFSVYSDRAPGSGVTAVAWPC